MSLPWNVEQILAMAPDASAARAGRELSSLRRWTGLGSSPRAAWGLCQGSGSQPYQVRIDLGGPAFHCSCPSPKIPCKHGLALLLLLESQPGALEATEPPGWVSAWLEARDRRGQPSASERRAKEPDAAGREKRAAERLAKVTAGLSELDLWMHDLMVNGLATLDVAGDSAPRTGGSAWAPRAPGHPGNLFESMAARLIDAQAPGLARMVRELAPLPGAGTDWPERLLERLAKLHLILEGFKRIDALPEEVQADLRALVGWTSSQEELLSGPGVCDRWLVHGRRIEIEELLRTQYTWLRGRESGRDALVLSFAHGAQPLDSSLQPGTVIEAELVFYPGSLPLRALVRSRTGAPTQIDFMCGYEDIHSAMVALGEAVSRFPWLEQFPMPLLEVTPLRLGEGWKVRDAGGAVLPLSPRFERGWELLAVSAGQPVGLYGVWQEETLYPLGVLAGGCYRVL